MTDLEKIKLAIEIFSLSCERGSLDAQATTDSIFTIVSQIDEFENPEDEDEFENPEDEDEFENPEDEDDFGDEDTELDSMTVDIKITIDAETLEATEQDANEKAFQEIIENLKKQGWIS